MVARPYPQQADSPARPESPAEESQADGRRRPHPATSTTQELEARIRALEAELSVARQEIGRQERPEPRPSGDRARRRADRNLVDDAKETADRTVDEVSRLFRSMTMAYAESLRTVADAVGAFSDELTRRRDADREQNDRERVGKLPEDVVASYLRAVDRALTIPKRTFDRFQDEYKEERDKERTKRRDRDEDLDAPRTRTSAP
jgi:Mg2+ and Co2+ transporter CorA